MKDLGDFSALGGTNSYGWGINNEGQVVGYSLSMWTAVNIMPSSTMRVLLHQR